MLVRPRSSWLLVVLLGCACLAYGAVAQLTASPVGALAHAPTDAAKAADTVDIAGQFVIPANQPNVVVYTVPLGKRLIVTSLWNSAGTELVELSGGHETIRVPGSLLSELGATSAHGPQVLTFNYPIGARFEPGTAVACSFGGGQTNPTNFYFNLLLVGTLVDA